MIELKRKALTDFKKNFCPYCEDKETCDISAIDCTFFDNIYYQAYKDGYEQGQKDKLTEKEKLVGTFINVDLEKENEELKKLVTEKNSEIEELKSKIKHIYDFNLCCDISRDRQSKEIIDTFQCLFDY